MSKIPIRINIKSNFLCYIFLFHVNYIAFLKRNISFLLLEILMPMTWYNLYRSLILQFGIIIHHRVTEHHRA